jgi:hypothetical protein
MKRGIQTSNPLDRELFKQKDPCAQQKCKEELVTEIDDFESI